MGSSTAAIIVYVASERFLVHAVAARALILGNIILSVPVSVSDSQLRILGNGDARMHPLGRFPIHPLRALSADALGKSLGKLCSWRY